MSQPEVIVSRGSPNTFPTLQTLRPVLGRATYIQTSTRDQEPEDRDEGAERAQQYKTTRSFEKCLWQSTTYLALVARVA